MKRNINVNGLINFLIPLTIVYIIFLITVNFKQNPSIIFYCIALSLINYFIYLFSKNKLKKLKLSTFYNITAKLIYFLSLYYIILKLIFDK